MKRHTKAARNRRRSHLALTATTLNICSQCKKPIRPHCACGFCGYYKKRAAVKVKVKVVGVKKKK